MAIEALRTPDERFRSLAGYAYDPHYVEDLPGYDGLRMHYVDEGARDSGHVFLCLHGEPTWAYLYRKMIPVFTEAGARVVAPDFFGFGRSDKPVADEVYTFDFHQGSLLRFVEALDLRNVTLVAQDWGGILGLSSMPNWKERVSRLLVMNTALPTGRVPPSDGFMAWRGFMASQPDLAVGKLMRRATDGLSEEEAAAYDAPFPDARHKAGVRRFPAIVPITEQDAGADVAKRAERFLREEWSGPTFMAVGAQDPVLGPPVMDQLREIIRGCPEPLNVDEAGHFVQEHGERVARAALASWG